MKEFWSQNARGLTAYVPGEQPKDKKYIKLNTNECPYPPSPAAIAAAGAEACGDLRLYPDPECSALTDALSEVYGVPRGRIFVGNGSDELLAMCFPAFFDHDRTILFPDITYSFYPVLAGLFEIPYRTVPLNADFSVSPELLSQPNGGVLLPNPNAPTGLAVGLGVIRGILQANRESVVIIDEAYVDFGAESALPLIDEFPNLLVIQTASKSRALAGIRAGWAFGNENLIDALLTVKNSFNSYTMNRLALSGAAAGVRDTEYFELCRKRIMATRSRASQALGTLGFNVVPSSANFLFVSHESVPAKRIFAGLRQRGILVRYFDKPRIDNYLRITVGAEEQMAALEAALREILAE